MNGNLLRHRWQICWGLVLVAACLLSASRLGQANDSDLDTGLESPPEIDEDVNALVVPADLLGKIEKPNLLQFQASLRGLLKEGISPKGAGAAKRHYEAAHRAVPKDPRAAFALGLAFLEQKNTKAALEQFQTSLQQAPGDYLPALQARAWTAIQRHEYTVAVSSLKDLARRLESISGNWPSELDRMQSAEWLGRVVEFFEGPGALPEKEAALASTISSLGENLQGERRTAFDQGRALVSRRRTELEAWSARPVAEIVAEINARRKEAQQAAHAAEDNVKQIEKEIKQSKKPIEKQIAEGTAEFRANRNKVKIAAKVIPDAEEKVQYLSIPQQYPDKSDDQDRRNRDKVRMRDENALEKKARETQLNAAKLHLQQLRTNLADAQQALVDSRKELDKAKAELRAVAISRQADLREARQKLTDSNNRLRDLERAGLSPDQIKSRATSLDSYVPFDALAERDRLLETLKSR